MRLREIEREARPVQQGDVRSCPLRSENGASVSSHAKPTIQPGPESISALRPAPFTQRDRGRVAKVIGSCGMLLPFMLNADETIPYGSATAGVRPQGCGTGNNSHTVVQSRRHPCPDMVRWITGTHQRPDRPWTYRRLLRRHAAIDDQFRAGDPR